MKEPNKLKYPLWFHIVFYILTVVAPIVLSLVQGFRSPSTPFKVSFGVICALIIGWMYVRRFVLRNVEKRIVDEKALLEHDYSIESGSPEKIKYLWYTNELKLNIINVIQIVLIGLLIGLIAVGIQTACIKIKATLSMVALCYIIAYGIKFIYIIVSRDNKVKGDDTNGTERTGEES